MVRYVMAAYGRRHNSSRTLLDMLNECGASLMRRVVDVLIWCL